MGHLPFQFHLSAALIAVLVGGDFIELYIRPESTVTQTTAGTHYRWSRTYSLGWPLVFYSSTEWESGIGLDDSVRNYSSGNGETVNILNLAANLLLCAVIIYSCVRLSNHFMFRRKQY